MPNLTLGEWIIIIIYSLSAIGILIYSLVKIIKNYKNKKHGGHK